MAQRPMPACFSRIRGARAPLTDFERTCNVQYGEQGTEVFTGAIGNMQVSGVNTPPSPVHDEDDAQASALILTDP